MRAMRWPPNFSRGLKLAEFRSLKQWERFCLGTLCKKLVSTCVYVGCLPVCAFVSVAGPWKPQRGVCIENGAHQLTTGTQGHSALPVFTGHANSRSMLSKNQGSLASPCGFFSTHKEGMGPKTTPTYPHTQRHTYTQREKNKLGTGLPLSLP